MSGDMKKSLEDVQAWKREVFEPWKEKMAAYNQQKAEEMARLREHAGQLEAMVAMLLEGKTKSAMLAWNALGMHPKLRDLRLSDDGETLTLVDEAAQVTVLKLETLMAELQQMLEG